jgi:hypothetical protein
MAITRPLYSIIFQIGAIAKIEPVRHRYQASQKMVIFARTIHLRFAHR